MVEEKDYITGLHSYLKENFGEGFKLTTDQFKSKLSTDSAYANQLHGYLKENFGDDFKLDIPTFQSKVGYIDNSKKKANLSQDLGDFTKPLQVGAEKPLPSTSSSQLNVKSEKPINPFTAPIKDIEKVYGKDVSALDVMKENNVLGMQRLNIAKERLAKIKPINPFTAPIKDIEKVYGKDVSALDVMKENNVLGMQRLNIAKERLAKIKELKQLKLREPELKQQTDMLKSVMGDVSQPYEKRVQAQNEINKVFELLNNANAEVENINKLNEDEKVLINKINANETIRQQKLEKEYSGLENFVEATGKALIKLPVQLANMTYSLDRLGESIVNPEMAMTKKEILRKTLKPIEDFADGLIKQETPANYKEWFKGDFSAGKLGYLASEAIGQTLPTVAAGFLTGGVGAVATGAAMAFDESRNMLLEAGFTPNQADAGSLGMAIPLGLLEKYGISDIIAKPIGKKILKETAEEVIKKLGTSKITNELVFETTKKTFAVMLKKYGLDVIESAWKEPLTEMTQAVFSEGTKQVAEEITGKDSNAKQTTEEYLIETGKNILGEGLSGALGGVGISAVTSAIQSRTNPSAYGRALELMDTDLFEDFIEQLKVEVEKGIITAEQADNAIANVKKIQEVDAKIPKNIAGAERRSAAASLISKKEELETEIEGKDKVLITPIVEEIKIIDQTLSEIAANKPIEEIENGLIDQNEENKVAEKTLEEQKVENKNENAVSEVKTNEEKKTETPKESETTTTPSSSNGSEVSAPISVSEEVIEKDGKYSMLNGSYADVEKKNDTWHIEMIESKKDRKGDGTKIISKIISDAKAQGVKKIEIQTSEGTAYGFAKKLGFTEIGDNIDRDNIPMELIIKNEPTTIESKLPPSNIGTQTTEPTKQESEGQDKEKAKVGSVGVGGEGEVEFGTAFNMQDATAENTVGKEKDLWGKAQVWRERIENAGDILRELSSRGDKPDVGYLMEKVKKLRDWIAQSKKGYTPIDKSIKTIEDFEKTSLRWSDAVDSREYIEKFHSSVLDKIRSEYEAIPTYTKEQRLAVELVLDLINNNIKGLESKLNEIENISNQIKANGKLPIIADIKLGKAVEQSLKATPKGEVKESEAKVEAEPKKVESLEEPIVIFKGKKGKLNADGSKRSAHPDVEGVFGSTDLKSAERYGDDISEFSIPKGTTIETVEIDDKKIPMSEARRQETELINASDAQIVRLITSDAKGKEVQYIIKDKSLLTNEQTPTNKEQAEKEYKKISKRYFELDNKEDRTFEEQKEIDAIEARMSELSTFLENASPTTEKVKGETATEKIAKAEKSIDDAAQALKEAFGFLIVPQDPRFKTKGLTLESLIDLVAQAAKQLAKGAIVTNENIKEVLSVLKKKGFLEGFDEKEIEAKAKEAVNNNEATIVKDPILKRLNKAFLKIGTEILDNAEQLAAKAKELVSGGKQVQYNITLPDGSQKQVKAIDVDVVNGFYSPLEKVISEAKQDKMPAKQWAEKFAKGEEAKWTGLNEWLAQQQGSVSKAEIQQYLKDNRIQVVEVVKGSEKQISKVSELPKEFTADGFVIRQEEDGWVRQREGGGQSEYIVPERALKYYNDEQGYSEGNATKFSQYQLEGEKENYKEVLVTMPQATSKQSFELIEGKNGNWYVDNKNTGVRLTFGSEGLARSQYDKLSSEKQVDWNKSFKSSHFDEPNILVHLRMNTRTDSEGNKVLFLEEVQSDWGQTGKKEGFKEPSFEWDTQLGKDAVVVLKKMNETAGFNDWKGLATAMAKSNDILNDFQVPYDSKDLMLKWHKAVNQERKVPTAPFVMDTNAWTKLGLKYALKEAVKQGATKIAWTTGEQQNDRYDLSKQVSKIDVEHVEEAEGVFFVDIALNDGEVENLEVENGVIRNNPYKGQKLDAVLGKEYADKILSTPKGDSISLTGNDLKLGGKGMKGFYGSPTEGSLGIVGNVAKSLFKQEPKTVEVDISKDKKLSSYNWTVEYEYGNDGSEVVVQRVLHNNKEYLFNTKKEAQDFVDNLPKQSSTQHSIDITPELAATVEQGQPLFHLNDKGEILGFTFNGKIYLNGEKITAKTTMEEAGHIWINWAKENRSDLYQQGLEKLQGSKYSTEVNNNPSYQKEALIQGAKGSEAYNAYMQEEALAKAIADNGAKFITETKKASFKEWVNAMWKEVAKAFGIQNLKPSEVKALTLEQFAKMAAADVFSKEAVNTDLETDKNEEIRLRNKEADKKGSGVSEWLSNFRENIVSPQELTDLLEEMKISKTILTNAETIKQAQEILDKYQEQYEKGENYQDPIIRVIEEAKKGDLGTAVGQVMVQMLFKNTAKEISNALKEGNEQKAKYFFDLQAKIVEAYSEQGTDAGRALQVRKMFMDYVMSDPELADFYYMKDIQNKNDKNKKNETLKESADEIKNKVDTAKEKAKEKVAGNITVEIDTKIDAEISKAGGIGRNATEAKKQQVKDYMSKLREKLKTYNASTPAIISVSEAQVKNMLDGVEKLLLEGNDDLQSAIAKVSAKMIRDNEATPKETTAIKLKINGARQELKKPKEKTPEQREREKANAELKAAKEEYNTKQKEANDLEKRIKAWEEKVAALKEKEAKAQKDRIDATELQRIQMAAKEVQKELEAIRKQEIAEKRDLSARILKQEEKLAALKAKEQEAIDNANAKRDLDAALLEQKRLEANKKELQKNIKSLAKEVINAAKKSDQNVIESIIEAFYSKEDQLQSDLEEMVVEALGVTEREAVKIAESIKNQMETELRSKLIKELENATKLDEERVLTADEQAEQKRKDKYLIPFIGKYLGKKKSKGTIVDKLLQLSMMGVLKTDDIMDLMKNKYSQQEFTFEMSTYIKEQAKKINEATTQGRKNKEMAKLTDKMAELAPLYYNEAMNSLWYGAVLSGFGTQDANITFNAMQVVNSFYRALSLTVFNNLISKGSIVDKTKSIGNDLYQMFFRTLYQAGNEGVLGVKNLLGSTRNSLFYGLQEGVSSFAETQKALESQQQSEMDYSRYAKWMKPLNYFKYVNRALSAMDLATQDLIKNSWIIPILREVYAKQGLSPKAIDAKIQQELTSTANEIEVATNEAIADIVKYDISVKKVGDKYHVMYEDKTVSFRGGFKKGFKKTVFIANTEQEAIDLKEAAAKEQTVAVKRFAYEILQTKINEQALKSATHLSQETIMSAAPSGLGTSYIYDEIINLKNTMTESAKKQELEARASNKLFTKIRKGQAARITYAAARIVPFVKMAINLAENFFIKDNPLGYVRAIQIESAIKNPKNKAQERLADFYQSQTQINDLKARAIFGTLAWAVPLLLTALIGDDDDEKQNEEYLKAKKANEVAILKELEESTGQPMEEGNPYLLVPKDGEVFGSLDFMQPQVKKALENLGLAKENSTYKGVYPSGKFVSFVASPSKFNYVNTVTNTVAMINKYVVNNKFDKLSDDDKKNKLEQVILDATLYSLMSFGSFSITKRSKNLIDLARQGKSLDAFAQTAEGLIPELAVANPAILRQTLRYIDGTSREFLTPSKDFTTYLGSKVPILGSFISVYGAEKRRGMFGEEMYSVPAMQQGGISNAYYDIRFGNKNKAEKEMYQFLASKGYNKLKVMPTTLSIKAIDGTKETVITESERSKLGVEASRKVFKRLQAEKDYLSKLPDSIIETYVDKLYNMEFKNAWLVYKGVYGEKQVKDRNKEFIESIDNSIEKLKARIKKDKENNVSDEMKKFRSELPKDKEDRKIYLSRVYKSKTNKQTTLKEWEKAGIIKNDTEKEEILKLAK